MARRHQWIFDGHPEDGVVAGRRRFDRSCSLILFSFDYPPADGGIARLCGEIAAAAVRAGVAVEVVSERVEGDGLVVPDAPVRRLSAVRPRRELEALALSPSWRSEAVLSGIWYPEGLLAAARRPRFHAVLAHGMELMPTQQAWRRSLWARLQRETLSRADLVIANSHYTADWVRRTAPGAVVEVVPLAVDGARFTPAGRDAERARRGWSDKRVILTVSRLAGYKAHDTVMRALAALPEAQRGSLVYAIAGRGPAEPSLRALADRLGIASQICWLGFVAESELAHLYAAADLFTLVTRESASAREVEGFGLVFLEAQACATPVVGARTGGIPDAVTEGEGGWLIEADDEAALTAHFAALVERPDRFRAEGERGRLRVLRDCGWSAYWSRLHEVMNRHGAGLP